MFQVNFNDYRSFLLLVSHPPPLLSFPIIILFVFNPFHLLSLCRVLFYLVPSGRKSSSSFPPLSTLYFLFLSSRPKVFPHSTLSISFHLSLSVYTHFSDRKNRFGSFPSRHCVNRSFSVSLPPSTMSSYNSMLLEIDSSRTCSVRFCVSELVNLRVWEEE